MKFRFSDVEQYILFGGGSLLLSAAEKLRRRGKKILVVTSERHGQENIMFGPKQGKFMDVLAELGYEYIVSADVRLDAKVIGRITPSTAGLSFGAPWIFSRDFIDRFSGQLVNFHGSRLPQNRGGGGFSWRIMRGDREGAALIHQVDEGVDTGNIILVETYTFPRSCRIPLDYTVYFLEKYSVLLDYFFDKIQKRQDFSVTEQDEAVSTYWPRLNTDIHGFIDWRWRLSEIERFICAFDDPYAGAISFLNGKKVRIKKVHADSKDGSFHPFQSGIIYRIDTRKIFVAAQEGSLVIEHVLDDAGNDIISSLRVGDRFSVPENLLEEARQFRAVYAPKGLKR